MKARILSLLLLLMLSGCVTMASDMEPWVGKLKDELIRTWGPPQAETTLPNGEQVLVYTDRRYGSVCRNIFNVDPGGRIIGFNLPKCPDDIFR